MALQQSMNFFSHKHSQILLDESSDEEDWRVYRKKVLN